MLTSPLLCDIIRFGIKRNPIAICAVQITHIFIGCNPFKSVWNPIFVSYLHCLRLRHRPSCPMRSHYTPLFHSFILIPIPLVSATTFPCVCIVFSAITKCTLPAVGYTWGTRLQFYKFYSYLLPTCIQHTPTRSGFSACFSASLHSEKWFCKYFFFGELWTYYKKISIDLHATIIFRSSKNLQEKIFIHSVSLPKNLHRIHLTSDF